MVICLERGADLHMAQLMPLPHTVSCFSKIWIGFTFLVPAYPGSPGHRAIKRVYVCMYVTIKILKISLMSGVVCTCIWSTIPSHLISVSAEHWLLMLLLGQHQSSDEPDWLVFWQSAVHWWSRLHGSCCKCLRQCFCCCLYCFVPFLTGKDKVCHTLSVVQAWCSSPFLRPWDHWSINGILWCMANAMLPDPR